MSDLREVTALTKCAYNQYERLSEFLVNRENTSKVDIYPVISKKRAVITGVDTSWIFSGSVFFLVISQQNKIPEVLY